MQWVSYLVTFGLACVLTLAFTPRLRRAALEFGIVDRPDGRLKTQRESIAYLGGVAIYLGFLLALAATFRFQDTVLGLLLAGSIVVLLGLIDDLGQLGPWIKLSGQLVAVMVLIKSGIVIELTFLPPWVAVPLSVLWMLAVINAFNLIDVMDGLSAGTAAVAALALAGVAILGGDATSAMVLMALAGACCGFLPQNFEPARIYMGDAGSMFLGLTLGALAMKNVYTVHNPLAALAPAMILGVPLFDMLFVMYVRWRRGMPVMLGSPDHFALRLRRWRLSIRQTVVLSYVATALLGVAALLLVQASLPVAWGILSGVATSAVVAAVLLKTIDVGL